MIKRCAWCGNDPLYTAYHDEEWGVPLLDEHRLFEMLVLEGAQAGLSWLTILRKRENYRRAFEGFDPERMARYGEQDVARLLQDPGIVRNRLKIEAAVRNARCVLQLREEQRSLAHYLWGFVDGTPVINTWRNLAEVPSQTATSRLMSAALKSRGFNFVGATICYAFMQSVGMVNDHVVECFRHRPLMPPSTRD